MNKPPLHVAIVLNEYRTIAVYFSSLTQTLVADEKLSII